MCFWNAMFIETSWFSVNHGQHCAAEVQNHELWLQASVAGLVWWQGGCLVMGWCSAAASHRQLLFVWTSAQIMAEISSQHELADNGNYQIASALGAGSCRAGVKGLSSWQYLDQLDFYGIIEMCYFHTSSTISFKLKCDISRFTHCIHEEMRSGCACICKSCVKTRKDNLLLAAVVGDGDGGVLGWLGAGGRGRLAQPRPPRVGHHWSQPCPAKQPYTFLI